MNGVPGVTFSAHWFDGRTAAGSAALLVADESELRARVGERELAWPLVDVRLSAPVAGVPLRLHVPDGGVFVLTTAAVDPRYFGGRAPQRWVDRLERNPVAVVLAIVVLLAGVIFVYRSAIPWLAGELARRVPLAAEAQLGEATLAGLDRFAFAPSRLPEEKRLELQQRFDRLAGAAQFAGAPRLLLRQGRAYVGANAMALPGGTVVVTDQLVARLQAPDEIMAVLGHELGHVAHRHTLRNLLEQSTSALIIGSLVGDVSGIGSLAASAPALIVGLHYSRANEVEADDYAIEQLRRAGLSPELLAGALESIGAPRCTETESRDPETAQRCRQTRGAQVVPPTYLSTHPDRHERMQRAREAAAH